MLKKRTLLLGAAVSAFGAMLAASAFSWSSFTDTDASAPTGVIAPNNSAEVNLTGHVGAIYANGTYQKVDDISVFENDPGYSYSLTQLQVTDQGGEFAATCGAHDYALSTGGLLLTTAPLPLPVTGATPADTGVDLELRIMFATTDATCQISGGEVTATFAPAP